MTSTPPLDEYFTSTQPDELEMGFQPPTGNHDRYILPTGDGGANAPKREYTRTSTVSGSIADDTGVGIWKARRTAWGLAQRDDLIARMRAVTVDDKDTIREVLEAAETVGRVEEAANYGTAIHAVLQRVDQGETEETIHEFFHPVVRNYREELERAGLRAIPHLVERVCRNSRTDTGGRFDNVYEIIATGELVIGDKKTSSDPHRSALDTEMQLAMYAHSGHIMDYDIGRYDPMPEVRKDFGLVVHIDRETFEVEILRVDLEHGWAAARVALEYRALRSSKPRLLPYIGAYPSFLPAEKDKPNTNGSAVHDASAYSAQVARSLAKGQDYCSDCDHDTHACKGCGSPVRHGQGVCAPCVFAIEAAEAQAGLVETHTPQVVTVPAPVPSMPGMVTRMPIAAITPPPTPDKYPAAPAPAETLVLKMNRGVLDVAVVPAVDPQTRVEEILAVKANDKPRLQRWAQSLGCTDLAHHRKWLAEEIVRRTPDSGATEPEGTQVKIDYLKSNGGESALAKTGLPPAPAQPPGRPLFEDIPDVAFVDQDLVDTLRDIASAPSLDALGVIWTRWTAAHGGLASWCGELETAGNARAALLRSMPPHPGDDGPPF